MSASHEMNHPLSFSGEIRKETGVIINKCYQCGKCSAGCPVAGEMDYSPSLVMRMLQTGDPAQLDKLLKSMSIWLCVSCEMCLTRCPMEIDIPTLMDYLRQVSVKAKKNHRKAKKIIAFHKSFLDSINYTGRLYEVGLIVDYKMRTGAMAQDVATAPKMLVKGKLNPIPEVIRGRKKVAAIFKKTGIDKEGK
ncbi:MAG: 4Fe-4S dicluster domain-containing protein [Bacteroidia bacterium]|nr:4Fe-4S dicluster domain-containing protein [Bacteroidia bacterium]